MDIREKGSEDFNFHSELKNAIGEGGISDIDINLFLLALGVSSIKPEAITKSYYFGKTNDGNNLFVLAKYFVDVNKDTFTSMLNLYNCCSTYLKSKKESLQGSKFGWTLYEDVGAEKSPSFKNYYDYYKTILEELKVVLADIKENWKSVKSTVTVSSENFEWLTDDNRRAYPR